MPALPMHPRHSPRSTAAEEGERLQRGVALSLCCISRTGNGIRKYVQQHNRSERLNIPAAVAIKSEEMGGRTAEPAFGNDESRRNRQVV